MCELKKCTKCLKDKDLSDFNKNKTKKQGVASLCKICHSEYRKEHYLKNKDKVLEQVNEYRVNNPDKVIKAKLNWFSKKAGRTIEVKCDKCDNFGFQNKKDFTEGKKIYCSKECRHLDEKNDYHYYLNGVKKRALKTNKLFNLDEDFIKDLLEVKQEYKCNVTNINIKLFNRKHEKSLAHSASLDRIDSKLGYTKDNVQWVSLGINYMKMDYSDDELHEILRLIKENYKK
jgi:hypothetical protein